MATYTVTTNANQEEALTWIVAQENARRANQTPPLPPQTNDEYLTGMMKSYLKGWVNTFQGEQILKPLIAKWDTLTNAQITQIRTIASI